uniref:Uncharacterized protein n=1 Tax=Anguilla anguilla TaxID=7936 RepID=A0A0E9V4E9_ANGAN
MDTPECVPASDRPASQSGPSEAAGWRRSARAAGPAAPRLQSSPG